MFQKSDPISDGAEDFLCQEQTRHLFGQPDVLLVHEYLSVYQNNLAHTPEMKLMVAVLKDGIDCYVKYVSQKPSRRRKPSNEAEQWFFGEDEDRLYSFQSVCDMLKLDAGYIRRILLAYRERHARGQAVAATTPDGCEAAMDGLRLAS
jgi:hypothetical protein